ncbi:MAG: beta-fructosidase [Chloroflexi bacterium]|nr:beta-fructosidase [Chloroflexota bacterium]
MQTGTYPTLRHPSRYVWDFWYWYDEVEGLFHLLYLNAPPTLVPSNSHHQVARVGYATTPDFRSIEWIDDNVMHARPDHWDNTSIWSGDVIRAAGGYVFFYTSRDRNVDDGWTQNIGIAYSTDMLRWERVDGFRLEPDARYYEERNVPGDDTVHAWRDPYLFYYEGRLHMLLAAKSPNFPPTRKGSVALLRSTDNTFINWEALPPLFAPGTYSECEVPQIYKHGDNMVLIFSCWARGVQQTDDGVLHMITGSSLYPPEESFTVEPGVLLRERDGIYAGRVIPELGGDVVGFHIEKGGLVRVPRRTGWQLMDRDFSRSNPGFAVSPTET